MEFNHPPDFGSEFNQPGNIANKAKGKASARENPNITNSGPVIPILNACTSAVPTIGPVHEKETNESVKAMKNIPIKPPLSEALSILFTNADGRVISKAPKKEIPKMRKIKKNAKLNQMLADS